MIGQTKTKQSLSLGTLPLLSIKDTIGVRNNNQCHSLKLNKIFSPISESHLPVIQRETEKERELRIYQSLTVNKRKLNRIYQDKLSHLLHSSKDPDYPVKREHINKLTYQTDEYNNCYLALPQSLKRKKGFPLKRASSLQDICNKVNEFQALTPKNQLKKDLFKDSSLRESFPLSNTMEINLLPYSSIQEPKILYEKLLNKNNFSPRAIRFTRNALLLSSRKSSSSIGKKETDSIDQVKAVVNSYLDKASLLKKIRKKRVDYQDRKFKAIDLFQYDSKRWSRHDRGVGLKIEGLDKIEDSNKKTLSKYSESNEMLNSVIARLESYYRSDKKCNEQIENDNNNKESTLITLQQSL